MTDPRLRGSQAPSSRLSKRDQARGIEEGLSLLRDAIKDLLAKPKLERKGHLDVLEVKLLAMIPELESVDKNAPAARRVRAMERVLKTLQEVSERT